MLGGELGADHGVSHADENTASGGAPVDVEEPVMPVPEFPTFDHTPTLSHQSPGNGFQSGRDSRAR